MRTCIPAAALALWATPGAAQEPAAAAQDDIAAAEEGEDDEIVVTGQRPRGSVIGDIPAENVLGPADVRAYGATSLAELLDDLAPQTRSARGRGGGEGPVTLLNGRRIASFREIREIPPEAIARVEILPEEVALKYGYRADQRVVNIVLRRRFRSIGLQAQGGVATEGGRNNGQIRANLLRIHQDGRDSIDASVKRAGLLREDERDIASTPLGTMPQPVDPRPFRSLLGSSSGGHAGASITRTVLGDVSATFSARAERDTGHSLLGAPTGQLTIPDGRGMAAGPLLLLLGDEPLKRRTRRDELSLASSLTGEKNRWRWSLTGNLEWIRSRTRTDRTDDLSAVQAAIDAGDRSIDPLGDISGLLIPAERDRTRLDNRRAVADFTASKSLFRLPAGSVGLTVGLGAGRVDQDSEARRAGIASRSDLGRTHVSGSANLDLPIARRSGGWSALGNLTASANAEITRLSDFGTLWLYGGGLNWSPAQRLSLQGSVTWEQGAPTIAQLGDPVLTTPGSRLLDFVTGETVLATVTTGGNPGLAADRRTVWKAGGTWQPWSSIDLDLRADYVRERVERPTGSIGAVTPALQAAFPERFVRDAAGRLLAADFRPVNFDQAERDELRWGLNFSKPLRSARPSQSALDQLRQWRGGGRPPGAVETRTRTDVGHRRSGGYGGRGRRGRIQLSLYHRLRLRDRTFIADGVAPLDYLGGELAGITGGQPRHELEFEGGWSNNGLGLRGSADWRSATRVDTADGELRFSPYFRFNLRAFVNPGDRLDWVVRNPWLRGSQVRLSVDNLFNSRPEVRGPGGITPASYQPALIDPLGRTVTLSVRKLFSPRPLGPRPARSDTAR